MKRILLLLIISINFSSCDAQEYQVTFLVNMSDTEITDGVGLRGNIKPLSWDKDYPMTDINGDGTYEATVSFKTSNKNLRYKFTKGGNWELDGADNRTVWFKKEPVETEHTFNEYNAYTNEQLEQLVYTPEQIKEDVSVLRKTLTYIHPNIYKYQDSLGFEESLNELELELLEEPNLTNVFKAVSKFAAKIKCSHTFTNPWNQGPDVKKGLFFQNDKVPFTFKRIGKSIFIDKNASEDKRLVTGLEIISIDTVPSEEIMNRLVDYISSDGNNYEKRLQRLTLSGASKFELFDIFYPLEFGSKDSFQLQLKNHKTGDTIAATVQAITKTRRNVILKQRYPDFGAEFEDGWKFELKDNDTAYLRMDSFAIFSTDFDWKDFINKAFKTIKSKGIENLILDIRFNEGGDTEVAEYIVEYIISESITVEIPAQTTRYRKISEDLKKYISTWDKKPYDWGNKVEYTGNGRYEMQSMFVPTSKTYKPRRNAFGGKVYLLTSAENSSATHIMSTYAKKYKLATLVGQETGGNQKGLNGGYMFFMRLPNSRIEVDIPVFGINILKETPNTYDGGIQPDILVVKKKEDLINGMDTELKRTLDIIKNGQ